MCRIYTKMIRELQGHLMSRTKISMQGCERDAGSELRKVRASEPSLPSEGHFLGINQAVELKPRGQFIELWLDLSRYRGLERLTARGVGWRTR